MDASELRDLRRVKYAKIDAPVEDESPTRQSFDSEDLDEHDPLNGDAGTLRHQGSTGELRTRGNFNKRDADTSTTEQIISRTTRTCGWRQCSISALIFVVAVVLLFTAGGLWAYTKTMSRDGLSPPWYPTPRGGSDEKWRESYRKASDLVRQMTLVEKVNITTGTGWQMGMCVGNTGPVLRLKFPALCLQDGPLGLRFTHNTTAFPAGVTVGATWNKELMFQRGRAHGKEARLKGINVILGPSMGPLGRMPAGGRNWEGFGPDPVLQGIAAAQTIKGIQGEGCHGHGRSTLCSTNRSISGRRGSGNFRMPSRVTSMIGHCMRCMHGLSRSLSGQAWLRSCVRTIRSVSLVTNRESALIEVQVNSSYACQNSKLMNGILKDEMGFQGFIQSDWLAQRSGVAAAMAGLDMSMPGDGLRWANGNPLWGHELTRAVLNGSVPLERINDMVTRVVASWYQLDQDQWPLPPPDGDGGPNFSSWTNDTVGKIYEGSPSDTAKGVVNRFVNVRDESHQLLARRIAAEGTVLVKNDGSLLPLDRNGWKTHDAHAKQRRSKFRVGIFGEDAHLGRRALNRCPDQSCNEGTLASGWGSGASNFPYLVDPLTALKKAFRKDAVHVSEWPENKLPKHRGTLMDQDLCIVFANSDAGEGFLRWDGKHSG